MVIIDGGIKLRAIEETDLDFCREMLNSSYIETCTIGKSFPISEKQQLEWFKNFDCNQELRLIIENEEGRIGMLIASDINWINKNCEVGIKLTNNGQVKRDDTLNASKLFIDYLFNELNMHCLYAHILQENRLSYKLLGKLGFIQDGVLRQRVYKRGNYHDVAVFSLLKTEYTGGKDE